MIPFIKSSPENSLWQIKSRSGSRAVVSLNPLSIFAADYLLHPLRIFKIPLHRLSDASMILFLRPPTEILLQLPTVNRISPVVPGTILDIRNQPGMRCACRIKLVENCAERIPHVDVLLF